MDSCLCLCSLLRNTASVCERKFTEALEGTGISHCQAFLLLQLSEGEASVSDVSKALCCSCGNITQIVDQLIKKGFMRRTHSAHDKRKRDLALTPKGQAASRMAEKLLKKQASTCCSVFSAKEKAVFIRLLTAYLAHHDADKE